jgi:hypothetical protein
LQTGGPYVEGALRGLAVDDRQGAATSHDYIRDFSTLSEHGLFAALHALSGIGAQSEIRTLRASQMRTLPLVAMLLASYPVFAADYPPPVVLRVPPAFPACNHRSLAGLRKTNRSRLR